MTTHSRRPLAVWLLTISTCVSGGSWQANCAGAADQWSYFNRAPGSLTFLNGKSAILIFCIMPVKIPRNFKPSAVTVLLAPSRKWKRSAFAIPVIGAVGQSYIKINLK